MLNILLNITDTICTLISHSIIRLKLSIKILYLYIRAKYIMHKYKDLPIDIDL